MAIQGGFLAPGPTALATFDFTDIAEGTGVVVFNLARTFTNKDDVATSGAILTNNTFYSEHVMTQVTNGGEGTFTKFHDIDFDVEFNLTKNVTGTSISNIASGIRNGGGGAPTYDSFVWVKIRKFDGTTETLMKDASGAVLHLPAGSTGDFAYAIDAIKMSLPLTHFKKGDILRVTVEQWGKATGSGIGQFFIGHDPQSRATSDRDPYTFGTEPSNSTVQIPFKLDV